MIGVNEILLCWNQSLTKPEKEKQLRGFVCTLLESLKHLNLEVLILAWHSLAACIMHMWIRVLCKIINQLHRRLLFASWFSKGAVKIIYNYTQIIQRFYIVWAFPVLCHGNNPTLEYKNKKFPFEGPTRQTLNFVCSTHASHINRRFFYIFIFGNQL